MYVVAQQGAQGDAEHSRDKEKKKNVKLPMTMAVHGSCPESEEVFEGGEGDVQAVHETIE